MGRELAYESYRVGKQKRQIVDNHLAHGGVKCGEQFVLGEHIAFAQQIHEGGLAYVGISYEGHSGKFAAIFTLYRLLRVDSGEFGLEARYFVEDDTAVGFNLRLAGTARAYTATLTLQVGPHSGKAREQILVLEPVRPGSSHWLSARALQICRE